MLNIVHSSFTLLNQYTRPDNCFHDLIMLVLSGWTKSSFSVSSALVLLCGLSFSYAFQSYQSQIPNGDAVPNPCTTNAGDVWNGVGHEAVGGAGARNPFGLAFAAAGNVSLYNMHPAIRTAGLLFSLEIVSYIIAVYSCSTV